MRCFRPGLLVLVCLVVSPFLSAQQSQALDLHKEDQ